jgi:hypothetical protein
MTEPGYSHDRWGRAERPNRVEIGLPARIRAIEPPLSATGRTGRPETATVATGGITPAEAELLGDHNLYNG